MTDMDLIVNLYDLPEDVEADPRPALAAQGIKIKRALAADKSEICEFIRREFSQGWADEAEKALMNFPSALYIAVYEEKVVGFGCYDTSALGYYGPLGVDEKMRGKGIAHALTSVCLKAMREKGYGYAIINAGPVEYYIKRLNAKIIGDHNAVFENLIVEPVKPSREGEDIKTL